MGEREEEEEGVERRETDQGSFVEKKLLEHL